MMKANFEVRKQIEISPVVLIGRREMYVISERTIMKTFSDKIGGFLLDPIYLIFIESGTSYAYSILERAWVDPGEVFSKHPALNEKLALHSS